MTVRKRKSSASEHAAVLEPSGKAAKQKLTSQPGFEGKTTEHKERAYVAASRRADRSIEARLDSAANASRIHKERTGKALRISRDIVINDEMYEEEDQSMLRRHEQLEAGEAELVEGISAAAMGEPNWSVGSTTTANAPEWNTDINTLFAQAFPNANAQARRMSEGLFRYPEDSMGSPLGFTLASKPGLEPPKLDATALLPQLAAPPQVCELIPSAYPPMMPESLIDGSESTETPPALSSDADSSLDSYMGADATTAAAAIDDAAFLTAWAARDGNCLSQYNLEGMAVEPVDMFSAETIDA